MFTVLHYFRELIAAGKQQGMVHETADPILVKEGRVKITYLCTLCSGVLQYTFWATKSI